MVILLVFLLQQRWWPRNAMKLFRLIANLLMTGSCWTAFVSPTFANEDRKLPLPTVLHLLYDACRLRQQQTGRFPGDYRELGPALGANLRRMLPPGVEFHDPDSAENLRKRQTPIGDRTPCLRYKVSDQHWLNVSCTGVVFESNLYWESSFVDVYPRMFMSPQLLAEDTRAIPDRAAGRSPTCGPDQVDLVPRCNDVPTISWLAGRHHNIFDGQGMLYPGGAISGLNIGVREGGGWLEHGGILFDARGVIQLEGLMDTGWNGRYRNFPSQISGIAVQRKGRFLHLLTGTFGKAAPLDTVAILTLHFSSGKTREFPLHYGVEIAAALDSALAAERLYPPTPTPPSAPFIANSLYHLTLNIPWPEESIETADFQTGPTASHPFLLALTVAP